MSVIAINTSQNVCIDFSAASVGERLVAYLVDLAIKISYGVLIYQIFFRVLNAGALFDSLDRWSVTAIVSLMALPVCLYSLVFESFMQGQTPGKKFLKIKVIKIDGFQAGFGDYLIRWIFRLVDISSNSGAVGLLSIIISRDNQRVGDMAAGTAVISLKNKVSISHTIFENLAATYQPRFPQVMKLSDNDIRIIKENLHTALARDDRDVIRRLAEKIREITGVQNDPRQLTDRQFIQTVVKDYNFFSGTDA